MKKNLFILITASGIASFSLAMDVSGDNNQLALRPADDSSSSTNPFANMSGNNGANNQLIVLRQDEEGESAVETLSRRQTQSPLINVATSAVTQIANSREGKELISATGAAATLLLKSFLDEKVYGTEEQQAARWQHIDAVLGNPNASAEQLREILDFVPAMNFYSVRQLKTLLPTQRQFNARMAEYEQTLAPLQIEILKRIQKTSNHPAQSVNNNNNNTNN